MNKFYEKIAIYLLAFMAVFFSVREGRAQSDDEKRLEVGAQFSSLGIEDERGNVPGRERGTEIGFGGRFTYNLNRNFALESEVNFFPRNFERVRTDFTGGRITQGLFGLKAGIRKEKVGFFGKVRPGFVSSGNAVRARFPDGNGTDPNNRFGFESIRSTQLTLDVGGVVEYYPSRRTILRFDVGDTITHFPDIEFTCFPAGVLCPADVYKHKLQVSVGFGFRF